MVKGKINERKRETEHKYSSASHILNHGFQKIKPLLTP